MECQARVPRYWPKRCRGGNAPRSNRLRIELGHGGFKAIVTDSWSACHEFESMPLKPSRGADACAKSVEAKSCVCAKSVLLFKIMRSALSPRVAL
ncbi:hypothetical protein TNCV_2167921 [Trichonephila clavipes]|nr:hypothetical protein TNCV_2167921 [Trichonephila clavipes]